MLSYPRQASFAWTFIIAAGGGGSHGNSDTVFYSSCHCLFLFLILLKINCGMIAKFYFWKEKEPKNFAQAVV